MTSNDDIFYNENQRRCEIISNATFPFIKNLKTLELGPQDGSWFTERLLKFTQDVTVIELYPSLIEILKEKFPTVKVIKDDFNECLRNVGKFEAVVLYGVLYHSHVPLKILEDVTNFINPKFILLEQVSGMREADIQIVEEPVNILGYRQVKFKSAGFSITLGQEYLSRAMINLGYEQVGEFDTANDEEFLKTNGNLKDNAYYTVWKLKNE